MIQKLGGVGLADFAEGLRALAPRDAGTVRAIARLAGLDLPEAAIIRYLGERGAPTSKQTTPPAPADADRAALRSDGRGVAALAGPVSIPLTPSAREFLPDEEDDGDYDTAANVAPLARATSNGAPWTTVRRPLDPLLRPLWMRGVLQRAASTLEPFGDIDGERLAEAISRREPPRVLPRLDAPSLMRGAQLMIDIGPGMEPYAGDQRQIVQQLGRVVGRAGVEVVQFRDAPLRGAGTGPVWTWTDYEPPAEGVPVIALSDIGIGGPRDRIDAATAAEWIDFASLMRRRGSPALVLVPYPAARWPRDVAVALRLVEWNADSGVQAVPRSRRGS